MFHSIISIITNVYSNIGPAGTVPHLTVLVLYLYPLP